MHHSHLWIISQWLLNGFLPNKKHDIQNKYSLVDSEIFHHACKTPLSILMFSLENALVENSCSLEQRNRAFDRCLESAKKLDNLLNMVKNPEECEDEVFDIGAVISEVAVFVNSKHTGKPVATEVPDALITGKKLYFQEAMQCLINNAVESRDAKDSQINNTVFVKGLIEADVLRLDLIDYGSGMSKKQIQEAQKRGVSFKKDGGGLGLPFAQKTLEYYFNSRLEIFSHPGVGTRIVIHIPL